MVLCFAAGSAVSAVELRVATFNLGAHFNQTFFDYSLGNPGSADHESVRAILARMDADVVALEEVHSADVDPGESPNDLAVLAAALGYPYVHVAATTDAGALHGSFDPSLRNAFLSRFPFRSATSIRSPLGAHELTRLHPVVNVDVPGTTRDPVLIAAHLKAGSGLDDRFRRAVEMKRLVGHLSALGLTDDDNYIILGDFNFNPNYASTTFYSLPTGLPATFDLGDDLTFPLSYSINPLAYFSTPGAVRLDPRQLDGSASTFGTASPGGPTLDLMIVSPAIAGRPLDSEVYNSALDVSNGTGLPKAGLPPAADTSATASDHYALFADLELDSELPDLDLALSHPAVDEGQPDGTVTATLTLPAPRPSAVTVTLLSDDPAAATPVIPTVVIPAGSLSGNLALRTARNFLQDPARSVGLRATAAGYDPDRAVLQVNDVDGPYPFTAGGQTVTENFSGFAGDHDPAPWVTSGGFGWRGTDNGSSNTPGLRAYGSVADPSLGFLPQGAGTVASATFVNRSAATLTALRIAFEVEQWRAALGGTADTLSADLVCNGQTIPLPALSHAASQNLPSGAVAGGLTTAKSTTLAGLAIPSGAAFELRVTFTPGSGGGVAPADVFVNEFHYDDLSTDGNEFIEIAVAPGFSGTPADVDVILCNGDTPSAAVTYGAVLNLANFVVGDVVAGYQLYSFILPVDGLQNGGNDGFAIIDKRNGQVLQLVSYEGIFTAGAGSPAAGLTSLSIGVSETNSTAEDSSLGLTGSGGVAADFNWAASSGVNSRGAVNPGQSFVVPVLPPQGLAIDNLSVTFVADTDFDDDGIADALDPDDDNDGQSDGDEIAFGTHPLDPASIFKPELARAAIPADGFTLTFSGAAGITYAVETSMDLDDWDEHSTHVGSGPPVVVPLPVAGPARFYRVRAGQ